MVDDEDEMEQVNHLVPKATKDRATRIAQWGELSEAVRSVYEVFANSGGDDAVVRLEAERQRIVTQREAIEEQIGSLQRELERLEEREGELEDRIAEAEIRGTKYEALCDELLTMLDNGESVWPEHGLVQKTAAVSGKSPDEVIAELQSQRPHLPETRFEEGTGSTVTFSSTEATEL